MTVQQVGRLAMRVEGDWWVAYYAKTDTMDGAIRLGSIRMGAVRGDDRSLVRKEQFMDLMRGVISDGFDAALGEQPEWTSPHPAPEAERSGSA